MRWAVFLLVAMIGSAAAVFGLLDADAQQFPLGGGPSVPLNGDLPGSAGPHRMRGWIHTGGPALAFGPETLGLVYDKPDKELTEADVQKIAEAFLLFHGNHSWRVTNVVLNGDVVIFAIATDQNAIVATFAMNRHSAELQRLS
jgi:hypothetical protein